MRKTFVPLALVGLLVTSSCAGVIVAPEYYDENDPQPADQARRNASAITGTYDVATQYNFLDLLPSEVDTPLQMALNFALSPGRFLLEQGEQLPVVGDIFEVINRFSGLRNRIGDAIDDYINQWTGGLVNKMKAIAMDVDAALRGLRSHHRLVIGKPDVNSGNVSVQDTLLDLAFVYHGVEYPMAHNAVSTVQANAKGTQLTIPAHTFNQSAKVGTITLSLLNSVILPEVAGVSSLATMFTQLIPCTSVANWIWVTWGVNGWHLGDQYLRDYIGEPDLVRLCDKALEGAGNALEKQIKNLDSKEMLRMGDGSCQVVEKHGRTGHADTIEKGMWSLGLPVSSAIMSLPGQFTGKGGSGYTTQ